MRHGNNKQGIMYSTDDLAAPICSWRVVKPSTPTPYKYDPKQYQVRKTTDMMEGHGPIPDRM
jgi:hypothetical protein